MQSLIKIYIDKEEEKILEHLFSFSRSEVVRRDVIVGEFNNPCNFIKRILRVTQAGIKNIFFSPARQ